MSDDFFDAEDPHPVTSDESPYVFDDLPSPRNAQSRRPGVVRPSVVTAPKKRVDVVTSSSSKRNGQRLEFFVQTVHEVTPLIYLAHHQNSGDFSSMAFEDGFGAILRGHHLLLSDTCDRLGLSQEDVGDRFLVSQLAIRLSNISHQLKDLPSSSVNESVGLAIGHLDKWISQNSNIFREVVAQERIKSSDILVNVKLGLFSPTIKLYAIYEKWKAGSWREMHASKLMDLSVDFAKDVAFNWDKGANFREKQDLFQGVLEMCANLVIDVYREHILKNLKAEIEDGYSFEHNGLEKFLKSYNALDVGYKNHDVLNEMWLLNKIRIKKESLLLHYMPMSMSDNESYFTEKFLIMQIDQLFSECWVNAANNYIEKVTSMPESEMEDFLDSEEGQKPMPFDLFEEQLEALRPRGFDLINQNLNLQEVALQSRKLLAEMWGVSDAFCKISKQ